MNGKFNMTKKRIIVDSFLHIMDKTYICGHNQWSEVTFLRESLEASIHRWHNGWCNIMGNEVTSI